MVALGLQSLREQNKEMQLCVNCETENVKQRVLEFEIITEKALHATRIICFIKKEKQKNKKREMQAS